MSTERTEEATNARIRQNKYDRQIAELTLQASRLQQQTSTDTGKEVGSSDVGGSFRENSEVPGLKNEVKELSEEILKTREKVGHYASEIATLKNRLKSAIDRADKAEYEAEEVMASQKTDSYDRMERGSPSSGNSMRRRVGRSGSGATTISSAMKLEGGGKKAVDALDSFSVSTGMIAHLRVLAQIVRG
jgi:molecular chaperone GrpE (heat shock protein)